MSFLTLEHMHHDQNDRAFRILFIALYKKKKMLILPTLGTFKLGNNLKLDTTPSYIQFYDCNIEGFKVLYLFKKKLSILYSK